MTETLCLDQRNTLDKVQANTNVFCLVNAQLAHSVQWLCYRPDVREIVLVSFNDAYISSVIIERQSAGTVVGWYPKRKDGNTGEKRWKYGGENIVSQCHFVHHERHMDKPGDQIRVTEVRDRQLTPLVISRHKIVVRFPGRVIAISPKSPTGSIAHLFHKRRRHNAEEWGWPLTRIQRWLRLGTHGTISLLLPLVRWCVQTKNFANLRATHALLGYYVKRNNDSLPTFRNNV